jgi:hypothetical protein
MDEVDVPDMEGSPIIGDFNGYVPDETLVDFNLRGNEANWISRTNAGELYAKLFGASFDEEESDFIEKLHRITKFDEFLRTGKIP